MEVFTDNWQHHSFSPSRFDSKCDFHTDGCKFLIVANDTSRPVRSTPAQVVACAISEEALSDAPFDGEINMHEMLRLLHQWIYEVPLFGTPIVMIGKAPFDARQIFDFCMAVIETEVIGWRIVKGKGVAYSLVMAGPDWVGAVASMDCGTGPQVLP